MTCEYCGAEFDTKDTGRPRRFCSDAHRVAAHRARREANWDPEVKAALAAARSIPGGRYPPERSWDPDFDPLAAEVTAAEKVATYGDTATGKAVVDWLATGAESKALVADATGAIILPTDMAVDIATVVRESGTIRALASVRPTNRNKQRAGLLSAATVGWGRLETGTSVTDAAIAVSSPALDIEVHDVLALATVGVDELNDTPEAARAAIVEAIGVAIGEAEDVAFAAGTGTGQPKGLTLAANVARVPAGQKTAASSSATPVNTDVIGLPWKLPVRFRRGAAWLASTDMAPKLAALTFTNGDSLMPNPGQGIGPGGWPFYEVPGLPTAVTAGTTDPSVWFVNLQAAYRVLDRGPIVVQRLTETYAERGYVGILVRRRVGGDLVRPEAAAVYTL